MEHSWICTYTRVTEAGRVRFRFQAPQAGRWIYFLNVVQKLEKKKLKKITELRKKINKAAEVSAAD